MNRYLKILYLIACIPLVVACEHKELCYDHNDHAHRYHINVVADYRLEWEEYRGGTNWSQAWPDNYIPYDSLRPKKPSGLRVINYSDDGQHNIHNIDPDGGIVTLYEGNNDILFYNNDTEYILFSRADNGASTRASTRTRTRASYIGNEYSNDNEETVNAPDMLYANFIDDHYAEKLLTAPDIEVTLHPLVFTYKIRYEFVAGLEYVALARGAISGMAKSVYMNTGYTSDEPATILFDAELTDYGVRALVNSFGAPGFPNGNYATRAENKNGLNLELLLTNGRTMTFEFDITDQIAAQPHGGVITVGGIEVKKEDGVSGSGAFDVEVNDWGEYEDIPLPL